MTRNKTKSGNTEHIGMPTLEQIVQSQELHLQLQPTQTDNYSISEDGLIDGASSIFDISGADAPSDVNIINTNGIVNQSDSVNLPNSSENNDISRPKIIRDNKLRHIYINSINPKPAKQIGYTHPLKRSAELERLLGNNIKLCKSLPSGSLLLEVTTFQQVQKVFSIKKLMNIPVSAAFATDIGTIKGYVHGPMLMDMGTEELEELWKDKKVVKVDRKIVRDEKKQNASLILTFKDTKIPHRLPIAGDWVKVQKFRKKLLQCTKCNVMYHIARHCKGKNICANCGCQHTGTCKSSVKRCSNCKVEGHGATDPQCPKLKREYQIASIRTEHKVGYAMATNILYKQNRLATAENHNTHGTHNDQGISGNTRTKIKKRKRSNMTTASTINGTSPIFIANSGTGYSWSDDEGEINGRSNIKYSKNHGGKVKQTKNIAKQPKSNPQATHQPPPIINEQSRSYASVVSPRINNSQIPGTSSMDVPKMHSSSKSICNEKIGPPVSLENRFDILSSDEDDESTDPYIPHPKPQGKKRPLPQSPESKDHAKNQKKKKKGNVVKDPTKVTETQTPKFNQRDIGTQTIPFVEKSITPTKYKNQSIVTNKDTTEEIPEGADFENVDNILQQLGKKVISSGNVAYIVKLLEALLQSLTKKEVDETSASYSGPIKHNP